jgi:glucose/arabinose dehydrogenase
MQSFSTFCCLAVLGWWLLAVDAEAQNKRSPEAESPALPDRFIAIDTSRLMVAPDPLPLGRQRVFPQLSFERPVELTHAGDGTNRLFVLEQRGVIHVFENRPDVERTEVFLDLREVVLREGNEEGLLGLAFHPRFRENGELIVYYSTRPRSSIVSRFRVSKDDPNRVDRDSEEKLLQIPQPYSNHNGGSIRFGPDGYLYIGLGDGGKANDPHGHAQNLRTLLGSILRIDVDRQDEGFAYAIPKDNPFVGRDDARGEIWAYGLRNVWRLAFDSQTGQLWAADVGQDRFEEINIIVRGGNYGWNLREGLHDFIPITPVKSPELIDPVVEYFRDQGISVTGGLVYRGPSLREYEGAYFYGDYELGNVWALWRDDEGQVDNRLVARTGLEIAAFGEDQQGEMYLCAFDGGIYQLRARDGDQLARGQDFPRKLSDTGLFASVPDNRPAAGVIPYEINMPFWSDYSVKDRYIALPAAESIAFDEREKWKFPVGTVFVKTFWMHRDRVHLKQPVRLETRLLVHSPDGWVGYTYVFNDEGSEAYLLDGARITSLRVTTKDEGETLKPYYFPSRTDCLACHTKAEGFVLGLTTRQMNRSLRYHGQTVDQIAMLDELGTFTQKVAARGGELERFPDWGFGNFDRSGDRQHHGGTLEMPAGDTTQLARAWLEVNCAMCHRPKGIAAHERDMRYHVALEKMKLLGEPPSRGASACPVAA